MSSDTPKLIYLCNAAELSLKKPRWGFDGIAVKLIQSCPVAPALEHQSHSAIVLEEIWSIQVFWKTMVCMFWTTKHCNSRLQCFVGLEKEGLHLPQVFPGATALPLLHHCHTGPALHQPRSYHNSQTDMAACHTNPRSSRAHSWWSLFRNRICTLQHKCETN